MAKLTIFVTLLLTSMILAKPAKKEALDKATEVDIVVNSVHPEKSAVSIAEEEKKSVLAADSNSNIYLSDVSFGVPTSNVNKKPGAAVARIIDDIFQIPIGVLQSVARLLRNPFISHKTPETVSSY